ncbi:dickkopf-related protein 4 isoform X3 [Hemicordylus capensis]|uniref:dickkopf-related protein 4 isoform X3 n=1 Tax=Hemicordylus capensis TaxID=884348 RepID=UPI00230397ED|nr:dickkopf-related protein 4 isoform X3 [Hemicordylus capensis]
MGLRANAACLPGSWKRGAWAGVPICSLGSPPRGPRGCEPWTQSSPCRQQRPARTWFSSPAVALLPSPPLQLTFTRSRSAQCLTDKDCPAGRFCHKPWEELPFCATCHGLRRRCQRTTMCCPGTLCVNAQEGEKCLRTSECAPGLCCARHFWAKICKPVLTEGQVCSKRGQKEGAQGPEIFQRCDCGLGLWCQVSSGTSQHSRLWVCQRN